MNRITTVFNKKYRVISIVTLIFVFVIGYIVGQYIENSTVRFENDMRVGSNVVYASDNRKDKIAAKITKKKTKSKTNKTKQVTKPSISSISAVVYCENTGEVLFDNKSRSRVAPLSTTKIVTAILAIQNLQLSKEIEISSAAASMGGAMALKAGEKITVENLLYGMLMTNSDDAAYALGETVSEDMSRFVDMMNQMVKNMGCKDTQFVNPTGSEDSNNYSTASDMMMIMKVASSNEVFAKISSTDSKEIKGTNLSGPRTLSNAWPQVVKDKNIVAVHKGDSSSGKDLTLVLSYNYKGLRFVVSVMKSPDASAREKDTDKLINYAINSVRGIKVISKGEELDKASVKGGAKTRVSAYASDDGYAYLPKEGSKELISGEVTMREDLKAPIKKGTQVGVYTVYVADDPVNKIPLVIKEDIAKGWFPSKIGISNLATVLIIAGVFALFALWVYIRIKIMQYRRRAARKRRQLIYQQAMKELEIEADRRRRGWNL